MHLDLPRYPTDDAEDVDPSRRCAKCGRANVEPRWHDRAEDYFLRLGRNQHCEWEEGGHGATAGVEEHLHLYCRCGFSWAIPVVA